MTQAPLVVQEVPGVPKHGSGIGQSGASVDAEMNQEVSSTGKAKGALQENH